MSLEQEELSETPKENAISLEPISWLNRKIVNEDFVNDKAPCKLESQFQIGDVAEISLFEKAGPSDETATDIPHVIPCIITGVSFDANKVFYNAAIKVEGVPLYAVIEHLSSEFVDKVGTASAIKNDPESISEVKEIFDETKQSKYNALKDKIIELIKLYSNSENIDTTVSIQQAYGLDSLDAVEIVIELEEAFDITIEDESIDIDKSIDENTKSIFLKCTSI